MRLVLSLFISILFCQSIVAQNNTSSIFRFLDVTPAANAAALGGNHVGLYSADFSLLNLNPAYLNADASGKISATYLNFFSDANMGFTNGAFHLDGIGTFAAGIRFMGYGDFEYLDENGNNLGGFNANDFSFTTAYSLELTENLNVGAGIDIIHSSYSTFKSTAAAISGGLFYRDTTSHFSAGLSIRNLGGQISAFDERREPLPLDISAGITKKPEAFPFQLSLTLRKLNDWDLRVFGESEKPAFVKNLFRHIIAGGEASFTENFNIRLGYDYYLHEQTSSGSDFDLAGIAFGVGFKVKMILVDISRSSYSKLGGVTRLSIKTDLFDL
ncbi:MAG: type IX secretion system protein PorQ [Balneolaceae bacterium]